MSKLTIFKGEEYRDRIKKEIDKESYLYETYQDCIKVIKDICRESKKQKELGKQEYSGIDNILLIKGRRGDGKTSTMCTIAEFLKKNQNDRITQTKYFLIIFIRNPVQERRV